VEDLRGHDQDWGVLVLGHVAGHDADALLAEQLPEITELLIRQCLDGRAVEDGLTLAQRAGDGGFGDNGFAGASGGRKEQRMALLDGIDSLGLKGIEGKRIGELKCSLSP
jgi:hypothetical protein